MSVRRLRAAMVIFSMVAAALFIAPRVADAGRARVHAARCIGSNIAVGSYLTALGSASVTCPIPSDSGVPHAHTTALNLYGHNASSFTARACVMSWSSFVVACGPRKGPSGTGHFNLSLQGNDLTQWKTGNQGTWFPYVAINMSFASRLYGLLIST
ncbi:MAG: hypothetical protein H6730_14275 [Deltaproteobacteria bacterium]|nr:hypothetical protein [Deltaproteobacteria bacterium]